VEIFDFVNAWFRSRKGKRLLPFHIQQWVKVWIQANKFEMPELTNTMMDKIHTEVTLHGICNYMTLCQEIYSEPTTVETPLRRLWVDKVSRLHREDLIKYIERGEPPTEFVGGLPIEFVMDLIRDLKAYCEEKVPGSTPDSWGLDLEKRMPFDLEYFFFSAVYLRDSHAVVPPELPAGHFYV